jgi:transposase
MVRAQWNMARYKEPDITQWRLVPINFSELFPEDHPLAQLLAVIRKLDLREFDASYQNDSSAGGRPAAPCERILAIIVYSLLYGGISMRNLQRELSVRADLMYLSGGMIFDHTTFCVFRKRHHEAILKLFSQTVFLGAQAGLIDLDTVCIDSTKIKAWANRRDIANREELERRYEHAKQLCEKRYKEWEECEQQEEKKALEKRVARTSKLKVKIQEAYQFLQDHPERKRVHLHEPDADWQKDGSKGFIVGYSSQLGVDSKSQMIVYEHVVTDQADTHQCVPIVEAIEAEKRRICEIKRDEVKYVLDCGYFSGENLKALEDREVYMPDQAFVRQSGGKKKPEDRDGQIGPPPVKAGEARFDGQSLGFAYEAEKDQFVCPRGQALRFQREQTLGGDRYRGYRKSGCGGCDLRARCIGTQRRPTRKEIWIRASELAGLEVKVIRAYRLPVSGLSPYELALAMRAKLSSPEGKAVYAKRFQVSEGVFAAMKGLRAGYRFMRRGLERVREEWAERCIAHNLAKMAGFTLCSLMEW